MSDVAIVTCVALVAIAAVAVVWLRQRHDLLIKADARAEREHGLVSQFEALKAEVGAMRTEQKTFLANARSR